MTQIFALRKSEALSHATPAQIFAPRKSARGFTLVEVLIALAIMAVGITAAIGLFTAATAMHKRALDQTTAALLADAAIAEARGAMTLGFDARALEAVRPPTDPPVLYFRKGAANPSYPGYVFDLLLTPIGTSDPDEADAFHAEVRVRWKSTNIVRVQEFHAVVARRVAVRDLR